MCIHTNQTTIDKAEDKFTENEVGLYCIVERTRQLLCRIRLIRLLCISTDFLPISSPVSVRLAVYGYVYKATITAQSYLWFCFALKNAIVQFLATAKQLLWLPIF